MSDENERLKRHVAALAAVNRELADRLDHGERARRGPLGVEWATAAPGTTDLADVSLVRFPDGVISLLEGPQRRPVRSGHLVAALEAVVGNRRDLAEGESDGLVDGPPVEVIEGPSGPPFVVVAGHRLPVRGLPLPHPVPADVVEKLPEGPQLDLTAPRPPVAEADAGPTTTTATAPAAPLPTFLIIGAQKSATRWLRTNLDAHPDVFTAPGEPGFFNDETRYKREGLDGYRNHFVGWSGEAHVGESTPGYLMWGEGPEIIAERIQRSLPDVRLVALLRNPVDRARSAMLHHVLRQRLPSDVSLLELVRRVPPEQDQLGLISGGWYGASLTPYVERFGDRLLVLLHDDVLADPDRAYRRVLRHLGAEPFEPPNLGRFRESQESLVPEVEPLTDDDRRELFGYFRDDLRVLEGLLDRDLSAWDPEASSS